MNIVKIRSGIFLGIYLVVAGCSTQKGTQLSSIEQNCVPAVGTQASIRLDSIARANKWPEDLMITRFTTSTLTPSPTTLAVSPMGEVYVGVDMQGSLGKEPGKGWIAKFIDCNNDGIVDTQTVFAMADNPRGIATLGDKVFVLTTIFKNGLADGQDLIVFEDKDHNHIADGPSKMLIEHIGSQAQLRGRGTDHSTNGIRMGIDGWIYIAVGDFGFINATDRSGTVLNQLGGGIVRVRPDGTEMEIFTHGTRNIYDVAIDPYMNIFTRDNTNDGGGWNIRFSHQIQSGEYGYPVLFQHFTDEIIPALVDVGGGSGVGSFYLDDPTWPAKYNEVPMMADWGRNALIMHHVTPDGATFKQKDENFIKLPQISDVDVDASGRMFLSAWDGAGFRGSASKGFVVRVVPKNWEYKSFPDLKNLSIGGLVTYLKSGSSVARLYAQQELITRPSAQATKALWAIASDKSLSLKVRVAGIFGYAQIAKTSGITKLVSLTQEAAVREFALKALADRKSWIQNVPIEPFLQGLKDPSERVRLAAEIGLGRLGRKEAATALLQTPVPNTFAAPGKGAEGPHATPNSPIVPAHIAVRSLVALNAVDACVAAIGTPNSDLALWALRYMHDPASVTGMIQAYAKTSDERLKRQLITTLARLYHKEAPYDGSWYWSTRPDTHGPYYKTTTWASSDQIKNFLMTEWSKPDANKQFYSDLEERLRLDIAEFKIAEPVVTGAEAQVDISKIMAARAGQVGRASIEDVMLGITDIKGDVLKGKELFTQQGCVACHNLERGTTLKGPFMGQIGSIMTRDQIAEAILAPNASISQGFVTVMIFTKAGESYMGFVTQESSDNVILRDITGRVFTIMTKDILRRQEMEKSMMPEGLAGPLTYTDFAALVDFLYTQK